jgi:hypothetical protein
MHAPPHLVAFVGRMGAGKHTAAAALVERGYTPMQFTAPLKAAVCALFGLTDEHVNGKLKDRHLPEWGTTPRRLMQVVGTDVVRDALHVHLPTLAPHDLWVRRFRQEYAKHQATSAKPVVVTGVRFPNEVAAIRELGGVVYRVTRPWGLMTAHDGSCAHASEAAVDSLEVDGDIRNDGTVAQLHAKVLRLVESRQMGGEPKCQDDAALLNSCIIPAIPIDKCRRFRVPNTSPVALIHQASHGACSFPWVVPIRRMGPGAYRVVLPRAVDAIQKVRMHLLPHEHVTGMRLLVNSNLLWSTSRTTTGAVRFFIEHHVCLVHPAQEYALEVDTNNTDDTAGVDATERHVELTAILLSLNQRDAVYRRVTQRE